MKVMFIHGGSRWKFDSSGAIYTDTNFNKSIWSRYCNYCDELLVILRKEDKIYSRSEAQKRFNAFNIPGSSYVAVYDCYRPLWRSFDYKIKREISDAIKNAVKQSDRIIIRSVGNFYTNTALRYAKQYEKPYLIEVTGFAKETFWFHSHYGKLISFYREYYQKRALSIAPYAVYVTDEALQKRYPSPGKALGCSDVEITIPDITILNKRLNKIKKRKSSPLVLGTAAGVDLKFKGQETVIKAIATLNNMGYNIEYEMVGSGNGNRLKKLAKKLNIENKVHVLGLLPHVQVESWLDGIDVYIHPSHMEGLCRSIIEAMSRACPVLAANVGGNSEMIEKKYLFERKNHNQIVQIMIKLFNITDQRAAAIRNFEYAKRYDTSVLNEKREAFYKGFIYDKL